MIPRSLWVRSPSSVLERPTHIYLYSLLLHSESVKWHKCITVLTYSVKVFAEGRAGPGDARSSPPTIVPSRADVCCRISSRSCVRKTNYKLLGVTVMVTVGLRRCQRCRGRRSAVRRPTRAAVFTVAASQLSITRPRRYSLLVMVLTFHSSSWRVLQWSVALLKVGFFITQRFLASHLINWRVSSSQLKKLLY